MRTLAITLCVIVLAVFAGCSRTSQQNANQRTEEAKDKARRATARLDADAKKLGQEVKQEARALKSQIGTALNSSGTATNGTSQAEQKLNRGGHELRVEADKAGVKLDHAALIAKIKAKLATDVGLSTVTGVDVDTTGQVVTLRGTVDSVQQKQQAEQAALQVNGITKVIDELKVRQ